MGQGRQCTVFYGRSDGCSDAHREDKCKDLSADAGVEAPGTAQSIEMFARKKSTQSDSRYWVLRCP